MEPIISFKNFSFQYFTQSEPTLNDINLDIYPGEKLLVIGPSGSGKSTLAGCINGLIPFAYKGEMTGSMQVGGEETSTLNIFKLAQSVGTVLQDSDAQFVGLTVGEDIAFSLENDCVEQLKMQERVQKAAKLVDMDTLLGQSPFELSGGQKQRTSLAGVMINDVDILLFDEPLANLDPLTGKVAIEIIDQIHKECSKTVIIIEHRLEDVLHKHVDRIIVMNDGRIIADMDPHTLCASDILEKNGIREPLYITALKYAGIAVTPDMLPGHMETLILSEENRVKLNHWHTSQVNPKPQDNPEKALEILDVSFSYTGAQPNVKDVSFAVGRSEMFSIIGKNGAGKTTLSKLICGFEKPDQGEILCLGRNLKNDSIKERAQDIGLVMQNPNQMITKAKIFDEVALGLRLRKVPEEEVAGRVERVLKVCGLAPFVDWPISALSYGQKKRVTIASILVLEPKILILDEPTAGQDYRHYTEIMEFLREINKTLAITVIMITHDMHLMLEYTKNVAVLCDAKLLANTTAAAVLTDPALCAQANLKETSLYALSQLAGISDSTAFVANFINVERQGRS